MKEENEMEHNPDYPYGEFDASKWAEEFDRIYPDRRPDTYTMLVWFANAIMTGYDRAKNESYDSGLNVQALGRALTDVVPVQGEAIGGQYAPDVARAYDRD